MPLWIFNGRPLLGIASHLKDALVVGIEVPQLSDGGNDLAGTSAARVVCVGRSVFLWISCVPSGKRLHNYGKSPFSMGKSTINGHVQ